MTSRALPGIDDQQDAVRSASVCPDDAADSRGGQMGGQQGGQMGLLPGMQADVRAGHACTVYQLL